MDVQTCDFQYNLFSVKILHLRSAKIRRVLEKTALYTNKNINTEAKLAIC